MQQQYEAKMKSMEDKIIQHMREMEERLARSMQGSISSCNGYSI